MPESDTKPSVAAKFTRPLLAGAFAATAAAMPGGASAASDIFLKLDGILGESADAKHKDQIEILSFSLGFVNQPTGGAGGGAGAGKVSCGDVVLTKSIDKASPSLIGAVMTGKHIKSGVLTFAAAGGKATQDYYTLSLTDLLVTSIQQSDSVGGPKVTEQVAISAAKFKFEYKAQKADGSLGPSQVFTFDCKANKAG
jgi:type VI secretion system secreted protein Hcp